MGRPRLSPGQDPVDLHVYVTPDLAAWIDGLAEKLGTNRSGAMRWTFVVLRYAIRELGDDNWGEVFDPGGELSGTRLGMCVRAELERRRPVNLSDHRKGHGHKK